jgi:NAD(P)H dehydrogenase (quinone)
MTRILVIYDSKTVNTEKMAYAVAEGVKRVGEITVDVKKVERTTLKDLQAADGIIIGSPTYYGEPSAKVKDLMDRSVAIHGSLEGKVGAAFTSSGGTASGAETTLLSIIHVMLVHGMIIQGRSRTAHYGTAAVGDPNDDETHLCRDLGERTAQLVLRIT